MVIKEKLHWIMDSVDEERLFDRYEENIDFVHTLGLKCDCVGWCEIDLRRPEIDGYLGKMDSYARQHGFLLRGTYYKDYSDFESDWYALRPSHFTNDEWEWIKVLDRDGEEIDIGELFAYKVPKYTNVVYGSSPFVAVSEEFRDACIKHRFRGIDFYWIQDIGRYDARQYFGLMPENGVDGFAHGCGLRYRCEKREHISSGSYAGEEIFRKLRDVGGILPRLSQMFYDLDSFLPVYLPKNGMPETDFAYIDGDRGGTEVLLHKRVVDRLLAEKVLKESEVAPIPLYDLPPKGYDLMDSGKVQYPCQKVVDRLTRDFQKLKENPRPERKATEKDALKLFRRMKRENKEYFEKGMPQKQRDQLKDTPYEMLIPYYGISDGGALSDEYRFLSYEESMEESMEFAADMEKEELLDEEISGIVIAKAANGDAVIMTGEGVVRRISHEELCDLEMWNTLAQFIYDSLEE